MRIKWKGGRLCTTIDGSVVSIDYVGGFADIDTPDPIAVDRPVLRVRSKDRADSIGFTMNDGSKIVQEGIVGKNGVCLQEPHGIEYEIVLHL